MIFTLLKRIFKEHSGAHLWVPILVVWLLSAFLDALLPWSRGEHIAWVPLWNWHSWPRQFLTHGRELAGIYLAFAWVVWHSYAKSK